MNVKPNLAMFVSLAVLVSACGGTQPNVQPTSASPAPTATAAPAAPLAATPSPKQPASATPSAPAAIAIVPGESWIVYEGPIDDAAGIRLVRPDGSDDHWAMPDVPRGPGDWQLHPDWSPDGQRIAFSVDSNANGTRDLWIADADGTDATRIVDCADPCLVADDPSWSPDGNMIAYKTWAAVDGLNPPVQLMLYDVASGRVRQLAVTEGVDYFDWPRWSPDGKRIVVELLQYRDRKVTTEVTIGCTIAIVDVSADGSVARRIPDLPAWATYPDWSPDGKRIVFSTRPWDGLPDGPSNLYTVRPDGTDLQQITHFKAGETRAVQPSWSPDGSVIVFTAVEGTGFGHPTMATIRPDGTGMTSATTDAPLFGTHPRVRPMP